jgi:hypothetical protein
VVLLLLLLLGLLGLLGLLLGRRRRGEEGQRGRLVLQLQQRLPLELRLGGEGRKEGGVRREAVLLQRLLGVGGAVRLERARRARVLLLLLLLLRRHVGVRDEALLQRQRLQRLQRHLLRGREPGQRRGRPEVRAGQRQPR